MTAGSQRTLNDPGITVVAVHAHPDDETLATGLALAHHALAGSNVHVITATLGEEGEVIPPELAHMEGSEDLGPYRKGELASAMATLGVHHEYLGQRVAAGLVSGGVAVPQWRDSGMVGSPASKHPRAFAAADLDEAAQVLAQRLHEIDSDVVLTYDPQGGYGHPDHIKTHQVTVAALRLLDRAIRPTMYAVATPLSWAVEDREWLRDNVPTKTGLSVPGDDEPYPPSVAPDDQVTHYIVDEAAQRLKVDALRHHLTQVTVYVEASGDNADPPASADGYFALSNNIAARLRGREGYRQWNLND